MWIQLYTEFHEPFWRWGSWRLLTPPTVPVSASRFWEYTAVTWMWLPGETAWRAQQHLSVLSRCTILYFCNFSTSKIILKLKNKLSVEKNSAHSVHKLYSEWSITTSFVTLTFFTEISPLLKTRFFFRHIRMISTYRIQGAFFLYWSNYILSPSPLLMANSIYL